MAHTATITWVDPTLRMDGTPIAPDTFHVNVFDSASPTPNTPIGSVAKGVQTFTTGALSAGVHSFTLTAVDSEGDTSAVTSPPASVTVPFTAPLAPTSVAAALN